MKQKSHAMLGVCAAIALVAGTPAQAEIVRNQTQFGTSIDVGQVVKGTLWEEGQSAGKADGQVLSRTGIWLTESGTYNDRLELRLTLGGLFFTLMPEQVGNPQTRRVLFGGGVGQAQGIYTFGQDLENPAATLQFGLFPHKYGESSNLGEYLFRSGAYPAYLQTGGWALMQSASYLAQGVRVNVPMLNNTLSHDFMLYMERDFNPAHDISPGYMITYRPVGFLEFGAGAVWQHGLPLKSDKVLTPKVQSNAYSKSTGRPVTGDTLANPCSDGYAAGEAGDKSDCAYYSFKGFKTMARASADLGMLAGLTPGDFKLYTEIALLGVENVDEYIYNDRAERMPVMAGVILPTFGLLDRLSLEGEYRKSRFPNTIGSAFGQQYPLPMDANQNAYSYTDKKTYWKWTAYARRSVIEGVTIHAQAANDHLRSFGTVFANPAHRPTTERNSDWYYVLRLEFGI